MINLNLDSAIGAAQSALFERQPCAVPNELDRAALAQALGEFNIYVIWVCVAGNSWQPMYLGQRKCQSSLQRLVQHLYACPHKTASKLHHVLAARRAGNSVGVTVAFVSPDSLRLAIEEELIYRNTSRVEDLPWNDKGRCA